MSLTLHRASALAILMLTTVAALFAPAAIAQQPDVSQEYAAKIAKLTDQGWREAFALGQEIADLPAEQGWGIMKDNWGKVSKVESRQQLLKAWFYGTGFPLKPRTHAHVKDVLELGKKDSDATVRKWAEDFEKKAAESAPGNAKPPAPAGKPGAKPQEDPAADVADIPIKDLRAGGDESKRYFLIGPRTGHEKPPAAGYRLVLVLPGGDGSAEFRPFVQRILKNGLEADAIIAMLVAPKWSDDKNRIVWPTQGLKDEHMKFSTEEFIASVIGDVKAKVALDPKRIDALGWSSGGPPVYAAALQEKSALRGAFVAMSVFKPETLPPVAGAAGKRFYILHSPTDFIQMRFPKDAEEKLRAAGAVTTLETYEGGHGWHGDVFGMMKKGFEWLEK